MQTVFIDSYFIVNLIVNYIMLIVTAKICAAPARRLRLAGAAAAGAAYAVACLIPAAAFLTNPFVKVALGMLMALAAFGGCARLLRTMLVFFAVSAAFGGVVMAASLLGGGAAGGLFTSASLRVLILSFAVGYVILALVFRRAARHKGGVIVPVTVRHGGREVAVRALMDTGNALADPLSGRSVMVAGVGELKPLFAPDVAAVLAGLDRKGAVRVVEELSEGERPMRFQLIPYSAVGVSGGMLLAFRPDDIVVDGKSRSGMLLALSPNSVSEGGTYSALIGA
jgi:stage II sporulation protein GA (sporulation sigma-E factor processing peptidase)